MVVGIFGCRVTGAETEDAASSVNGSLSSSDLRPSHQTMLNGGCGDLRIVRRRVDVSWVFTERSLRVQHLARCLSEHRGTIYCPQLSQCHTCCHSRRHSNLKSNDIVFVAFDTRRAKLSHSSGYCLCSNNDNIDSSKPRLALSKDF